MVEVKDNLWLSFTPNYTEGSYGGAGGNSDYRVPSIPSSVGFDVLVNTGGSSS